MAKVAGMLNSQEGTPVVIASDEDFPDALSVSSAATVKQYPLLLVEKNRILDSIKNELAKIKPGKVYIIGLQAAVSANIEAEIT